MLLQLRCDLELPPSCVPSSLTPRTSRSITNRSCLLNPQFGLNIPEPRLPLSDHRSSCTCGCGCAVTCYQPAFFHNPGAVPHINQTTPDLFTAHTQYIYFSYSQLAMASKQDTVTPWAAVLGSPNRKRALFQSSFPPILPSTKKGRSDGVVASRISPHQPSQRHQPQSRRRRPQLATILLINIYHFYSDFLVQTYFSISPIKHLETLQYILVYCPFASICWKRPRPRAQRHPSGFESTARPREISIDPIAHVNDRGIC